MKITIIGGGSYCWTPILFRDISCTAGLEGAEIVLEDINRKHLSNLHKCCRAILRQLGKEKPPTLNDPLCGSIRDYRHMEKMMTELLAANRKWLPRFFGKRST